MIYKFASLKFDDWQGLSQVAEIDQQAFGVDGISVFNLVQFARCGGVFGLYREAEIVAEAVLLRNLHDNGAVLFGFAVRKNWQKKGAGTALLQHLLTHAKTTGITRVELTANPEDPAAMGLYMHKFGFYKKEALPPHPEKGEKRWLLQLDLA